MLKTSAVFFLFMGSVAWGAPSMEPLSQSRQLADKSCPEKGRFMMENMQCGEMAQEKNDGTPAGVPKTRWQHKINPIVEFKAGYFFFSDAKMRKTYNAGGQDLQLSGSFHVWRWLELYGSVEYLRRHGKIPGTGTRTSIWEVPLSLGLKPVVYICRQVHYYLTLGPRYFFVQQRTHSPYLERSLSGNGLGGFVNTGFNFFPMRHMCIDIFGEYSYKRMKFHPHKKNVYGETAQVGGFTFGIGLGYVF